MNSDNKRKFHTEKDMVALFSDTSKHKVPTHPVIEELTKEAAKIAFNNANDFVGTR